MTNELRALCAELLEQLNTPAGSIPELVERRRKSDELTDRARALLAQPVAVVADLHYAWELEDAEGEWQAGGSADSLEDVQREGSRYLETYSQDGPHKLIIQRHCVTTIEEATNAQ